MTIDIFDYVELLGFSLMTSLMGVYLIYDGFTTWQRKRLIQDTATETVQSAAIGRTELSGTARAEGEPGTTLLADEQCAVRTYEVEAGQWHGLGFWQRVTYGVTTDAFRLADETGSIRVEPHRHATCEIDRHTRQVEVGPHEVEPPEVVAFLEAYTDTEVPADGRPTEPIVSARRRYSEAWIPPGETVTVLGSVEPVRGDHIDDDLVMRTDRSSDELIIADGEQDDLIGRIAWKAPAKIVGGLILLTMAPLPLLIFSWLKTLISG